MMTPVEEETVYAIPGFATPEEAAEAGFRGVPSRYVRLGGVDYARDGESAVVQLFVNEEPALLPYQVGCERGIDGLWREDWAGPG